MIQDGIWLKFIISLGADFELQENNWNIVL